MRKRSQPRTGITRDELAEAMHYRRETGEFIRNHDVYTGRYLNVLAAKKGDVCGSICHYGYKIISVKGVQYRANRLAWLYETGNWPAGVVDHINGDKLDNRFDNLRDVSIKDNCENKRKAQANNRTGALGVCFHKGAGKYSAQIVVDGNKIHLGLFENKEEASEAYISAKRDMHSGCTI